jgi:hypothetical protein
MKSLLPGRLNRVWQAQPFSPKDFVRRALFVVVVYGIADWAGLREFTSFLSGTAPYVPVSDGVASFLGCLYLVLYFAWVLLVPILLIAAVLSWLWFHFHRDMFLKEP